MKKILSLMMVMLLVALSVVPVFAANYTPVSGTYTLFDKYLVLDDEADVPGVVFNYEVTGVARKAPTAGSTFEVIATNASPHNTMPTMYQVTEATATSATAPAVGDQNKLTFVQGEAKTLHANKAATDWVETEAGEAFVKRIMKVDFTGVSFDEPGIYRYKIEESTTTDPAIQGLTFDTQSSNKNRIRYLDVYVTDNGSGTLVVSGYVLHENDTQPDATPDYGSMSDDTKWTFTKAATPTARDTKEAAEADAVAAVQADTPETGKYTYDGTVYDTQADAEAAAKADVKPTSTILDDKSQGYVNELATYDLEFGKEVEGNQGSKDKYFAVTVEIGGLTEGTILQLDVASKAEKAPLANSATTYDADDMEDANSIDDVPASADSQQLEAPASGTINKTFYLKDGQYIAIKGIPAGATYSVTEVPEDYKKTDGTEVATKQVLETVGDNLTNKHKDPVSGTMGTKEAYDVDNTKGMYWKDGDTYKELIEVEGTLYTAYTDSTTNTPYVQATHGDRYRLEKNVFTGYTNTRDGVIPTGVLMSIAGGAGLIAVAGIGLFALRRRKDEDEE